MMMMTDKNKQVDKAWDRLYDRLQKDGLLDHNANAKHQWWKGASPRWVASILLCCVGAWGMMMMRGNSNDLQMLHNQAGATLVTTLDDGSISYLGQLSSLRYPKHFEDSKREVFLQGNALFNISSNKDRPFIVDTETARVEVIGTVFNVSSMEVFSLSVKQGLVKVTAKGSGESVLIRAGEMVELSNGKLNTGHVADTMLFEAYTRNMQFKDERLADVVRAINQGAELVQLELAPGLDNRQLTLTLSNESPLMAAQLICMALNLKYVQLQHVIVISPVN